MKRPFRAAVSGKRLISETIGRENTVCWMLYMHSFVRHCRGSRWAWHLRYFLQKLQEGKNKERVSRKYEKEQKSGDRLQRRCRGLFWNRQLRSFLPRPDGTWLDFCCLALAQLGLAVMNIVILKNRSKPKVLGGKVYESEGFGRNRPSE